MQVSLLIPFRLLLEVQGRRRIAIGPKLLQLLVDFVLRLNILHGTQRRDGKVTVT